MEQKRFFLFLTLSIGIWVGWFAFGPKVFPGLFPKPAPKNQQADADAAEGDGEKDADADEAKGEESGAKDRDDKKQQDGDPEKKTEIVAADGNDAKPDDQPAEKAAKTAAIHPEKEIRLGSADPSSGYFIEAVATSKGAAIATVLLNDPRYRVLEKPEEQLNVVSPVLGDDDTRYATFMTSFPELDDQFGKPGSGLREYVWKVAAVETDPDNPKINKSVTFTATSPDGNFQLTKRYVIDPVPVFESDVLPILKARCFECHSGKQPDAGLDLSRRAAILNGGQSGPAIRVAHAESSLLWEMVATGKMPSKGKSLTAKEKRIIRDWINQGAKSTEPDSKRPERKELGAHERDTDSYGYQLKVQISIKNLSDEEKKISYVAQGPVGLPLENVEYARKFSDIKIGFLKDSNVVEDGVTIESMTSAEIAEAVADDELKEEWKQDLDDGSGEVRPFQCIGIDVQYFAALFVPEGDQLKHPNVKVVRPRLVANNQAHSERSEISLDIFSSLMKVPAGGEVSHAYTFYAGPKRIPLLKPIGAADSIDYGWFGFVSKAMLGVLKFFHGIGLPYGIAIIMLTVLVRACMFPISRKQAAGAKKMKELQPKIAELKKKYENDKEKIAKAQMDLFAKHNYNPLSGCLPMFLQLPIFIGLYQALYNAVDLRMAPFLWVNNLAAPDALFELPFKLWFLGGQFNLLPILTVVLFLVQQKMFMPPATDDQSKMQQKMMTYMMIFMGFMFYSMPSGLCVYFIASSLWGMGERKMLDYIKTPEPPPPADDKPPAKKKNSFWSRMSERIEAAAEMQQQAAKAKTKSNGRAKPDKKNRKSRSRR